MKLVLDTNIYCDYAEGLPHVVDFMAAHGDDIYLPSIVLGELTSGISIFNMLNRSKQLFSHVKISNHFGLSHRC